MAEVKIYKLYGTGTASANAIATLDIQEDGEICSVLMDLGVNGANALDEGAQCELSFSSIGAMTTNDTRASLLGLTWYQEFLTSGGGPSGRNVFITFAPHGIPVAAGERLYLHLLVAGTLTAVTVSAWVYFCLGRAMSPRGRVGRRVR